MMQPILIQGVTLDGAATDILIADRRIAAIDPGLAAPTGAVVIDARRMAAFPTFANMHTHAAMTLLKGLGSDQPLHRWLNDSIWPAERRLDADAVYWGVKLACLEMIKSGTTMFNDMYFLLPSAARAVAEMGLRATLGVNVFGDGDDLTDEAFLRLRHAVEGAGGLLQLAIAPHSVYTVTPKGLRHCADMCRRHGVRYHIHMSETEREVEECRHQHGCRPYALLERLGVLEQVEGRCIGAHSLFLDSEEIDILGRRQVAVVHNPASNLKLGSGYRFLYSELRQAGVTVALGTDGSASSNNLDMAEAARLMAYLQKGFRQDPTVLPVQELCGVATENGYRALGIDAGSIRVGRLADLMLVDLDNIAFLPPHDNTAALFYAAHGDAVDTVICNGRILMRHRRVDGEEEIREQACRYAASLRRS